MTRGYNVAWVGKKLGKHLMVASIAIALLSTLTGAALAIVGVEDLAINFIIFGLLSFFDATINGTVYQYYGGDDRFKPQSNSYNALIGSFALIVASTAMIVIMGDEILGLLLSLATILASSLVFLGYEVNAKIFGKNILQEHHMPEFSYVVSKAFDNLLKKSGQLNYKFDPLVTSTGPSRSAAVINAGAGVAAANQSMGLTEPLLGLAARR